MVLDIRTTTIRLFMALILGFLLTGCTAKKEPVELIFRITWDEHSGRGDTVYSIVEEFNESRDDIHVTMIGGNEEKEEFLNVLEEGTVDVYVTPYRFIQDSNISTHFLSLSDDFKKESELYYDTIIDLASKDDQLLGVPWIGHSMALIFNKNIIEQAGVNPYEWTSYEDLLEGCQVITEDTDAKGLGLIGANHHDLTWMINQFIYTFGGELVTFDEKGLGTEVTINSDESIAALDFYINQLGEYAQEGWEEDTGVEVLEAFAEEEIAFEIQGPWAVSDIWKRGNNFEVGIVPLEQMGIYSEVGPLMLSISKDTEYIEESEAFIEYLIEKDALEKIMDGEYDPKYDAYYPFRVPLRKDMEDSAFFRKYPEYFGFIEGFKLPSINTPCEEWAIIQEEEYPYLIHEVICHNMTIEEALKEVGE